MICPFCKEEFTENRCNCGAYKVNKDNYTKSYKEIYGEENNGKNTRRRPRA